MCNARLMPTQQSTHRTAPERNSHLGRACGVRAACLDKLVSGPRGVEGNVGPGMLPEEATRRHISGGTPMGHVGRSMRIKPPSSLRRARRPSPPLSYRSRRHARHRTRCRGMPPCSTTSGERTSCWTLGLSQWSALATNSSALNGRGCSASPKGRSCGAGGRCSGGTCKRRHDNVSQASKRIPCRPCQRPFAITNCVAAPCARHLPPPAEPGCPPPQAPTSTRPRSPL